MQELKELKESLADTQPVGSLLNCCKTLDQAKAVLKFVEAISEKTLRYDGSKFYKEKLALIAGFALSRALYLDKCYMCAFPSLSLPHFLTQIG